MAEVVQHAQYSVGPQPKHSAVGFAIRAAACAATGRRSVQGTVSASDQATGTPGFVLREMVQHLVVAVEAQTPEHAIAVLSATSPAVQRTIEQQQFGDAAASHRLLVGEIKHRGFGAIGGNAVDQAAPLLVDRMPITSAVPGRAVEVPMFVLNQSNMGSPALAVAESVNHRVVWRCWRLRRQRSADSKACRHGQAEQTDPDDSACPAREPAWPASGFVTHAVLLRGQCAGLGVDHHGLRYLATKACQPLNWVPSRTPSCGRDIKAMLSLMPTALYWLNNAIPKLG